MIKIQVLRDQSETLTSISISGHADFGQYGHDIVCAAVSGISLGMVNAIERMFAVQVYSENDKEGKLTCFIPTSLDPARREKIALLLEAMVFSLQSVAEEYPDYVRILIEKR